MKDEVNEHRAGLAFENKRWLGLVRTGQTVAAPTAYYYTHSQWGRRRYLRRLLPACRSLLPAT